MLREMNPKMARVLLMRSNLSKKEIDEFFKNNGFLPVWGEQTPTGRKIEPQSAEAMYRQFGFSEDEIRQFKRQKFYN